MSMINTRDIMETINMISGENLDVRTVTMGISLLDCIDPDPKKACENIYNKMCIRDRLWTALPFSCGRRLQPVSSSTAARQTAPNFFNILPLPVPYLSLIHICAAAAGQGAQNR